MTQRAIQPILKNNLYERRYPVPLAFYPLKWDLFKKVERPPIQILPRSGCAQDGRRDDSNEYDKNTIHRSSMHVIIVYLRRR